MIGSSKKLLMGASGVASGPATDPFFSDVSLLLPCDGSNGSTTFTDISSNALSVTANGDAQIDTTTVKFGTGSAKFDGSGDYLSVNDNSLAFDTGDFTIECWFYRNSTAEFQGLLATNPGTSTNTFQLGAGSANFGSSSASIAFLIGGATNFVVFSGSLNNSQWYHVAVTRAGTTVRLFVDGSEVDSGTNSNDLTAQNLLVGVNRGENNFFNGFVDDVRITKGVARYTSNFTPPTAAFPDS